MNFLEKANRKTRALVLMSGGLDSILAVKLLEGQGIETVPVCFESYFFSAAEARRTAAAVNINLRVEDISHQHLEAVKHPNFGYGTAVNPCIDCHLLMLKTAKMIMEKEGFDFIATGEVLGERPMSQNRQSLEIIEKRSGLSGKLLRPLSAKLLPETTVEASGLVDREKLFAISGRSRKPQMEIARNLSIKYFPQPGGGCILTETDFGRRLREMMMRHPDFGGADASLLRYGRPVWEESLLFIVARDKVECAALRDMSKAGDVVFLPVNFPGPTVLARDFQNKIPHDRIEKKGKELVLKYSKKVPENPDIFIKNVQG